MPRTNVWVSDEQRADLERALGKGVNLSGCIRAGLSLLLHHLDRDRGGRLRREALLLSELTDAIERAESLLTPAARARVRS